MTKKSNNKEISMDYAKYRNDASSLIYDAIPRNKEILCKGPSSKHDYYELSHRIHEDVSRIMADVLSVGKAHWFLNINPSVQSELPFCFRPKQRPIRGVKTVPMVIRSRDAGISSRSIRSLTKRLERSEIPLLDLSLLKYEKDRIRIADHWGHALSWHMSSLSDFTDACILLNQCNRKILAIRLCEAIETAMNDALARAGLTDYEISIPTYSRKELESSKQLYIDGKMQDSEFSDLVFPNRLI